VFVSGTERNIDCVEWVVKHYWLGDELQQEHLILVFFLSAIMLHNTLELSSPLKNQQLFFGFGKKKRKLKTHEIDTRS
jgi:hypothetical protein